MTYEEAIAWLKGERSEVNLHPTPETVATADAARTLQAYFIVKAHKEGLV